MFGFLGCGKVTVSYCDFWAPYRKNTIIGYVYADYVEKFRGRTCKGEHTHVALEGSLTTHASEHPPVLCSEFADTILTARRFVDDSIRMECLETTDRRAFALERTISMRFWNQPLGSCYCEKHVGARAIDWNILTFTR